MAHTRKNVKVTFVEVYRGKLYKTTKDFHSIDEAERESKKWNQFNNPYESLSILKFKEVK